MSPTNDRQRVVDLGDSEIAGDALRSMCLEPGRALRIVGGRVSSDLDLADARLECPLTFVDTTFEHVVDLTSGTCRSVDFTGCHLRGGLQATAVRVDGNLSITDCHLPGSVPGLVSSRPAAIWLTDADIGGRLAITNTEIGSSGDEWPRSLHADRIRIGATLSIVNEVVANGEIKLTGASVNGSVLIYGTEVRDPYVALYLSEARIGGNLSIMDDRNGNRGHIDGGLVLSGCRVGGQFLVHAVDIVASTRPDDSRYLHRGARSGMAVDATRARFDGDVRIYGGSTIVGAVTLTTAGVESQFDLDTTVVSPPDGGWPSGDYAIDLANATFGSDLGFHGDSGSIRLENATVAGSIHFEEAAITANQREGIKARNVRVEGDVWLDRATVTGGDTDFQLSHVFGDWRAPGARLDAGGAEKGDTLRLTSTQVDGSVRLNQGFQAVGRLRLNWCRIGGTLTFDGAHIRPAAAADSPLVVACRSATVASSIFLDWEVDGLVDFHGTETNLLADDPERWGTGYIISGLTYQRLRPVGPQRRRPTDDRVEQRLRWLAGQTQADPGTYSQLADYYRRHGRTLDAEKVLMARNRFLRGERREQGGWRNRMRNLADVAWDVGVGYGYRASRAAVVLVALIAFTALVLAGDFARGRMIAVDEDNVIHQATEPCDSGTVRCYNPVFYAVDTVVPLIDLQQRSTWYVSHRRSGGAALQWGLYATVLLGWAASSALVLGLTRTLTPRP